MRTAQPTSRPASTPAVAYLSLEFPSAVEPYIVREINALRRRGVRVVPCTVLRTSPTDATLLPFASETLNLWPLRPKVALRALLTLFRRRRELSDFLTRITRGPESCLRRARALFHTWIGACLAHRLASHNIDHIHIHHGYAASWIGMVAARLLNVPFSFTLHGSDLLLHPFYLDTKLKHCDFCTTISEYNRRQILERYPGIDASKITVQRLGVPRTNSSRALHPTQPDAPFHLLSVGRLHRVKDHAFLVKACRALKTKQFPFLCTIVGDGPERASLQRLIAALDLTGEVRLTGHIAPSDLDAYYDAAHLVVLTSRSEGIPLVLMEAMARGRPVLAPAITGIPELVVDGDTGFLYQPGSIQDFTAKVELIRGVHSGLSPLIERARNHVLHHFDQETNLASFCDFFLAQLAAKEAGTHADSVLQQI